MVSLGHGQSQRNGRRKRKRKKRLEKMRKRRKMEGFALQSLRNVVKEGGPNVVTNFEKKFKEIKVEGKQKGL